MKFGIIAAMEEEKRLLEEEMTIEKRTRPLPIGSLLKGHLLESQSYLSNPELEK